MANAMQSMNYKLYQKKFANFYSCTRAFQLEIDDHFRFNYFTFIYPKNIKDSFEIKLTDEHDQSEGCNYGLEFNSIIVTSDSLNNKL